MEEKINTLADFSLELIECEPTRITEFYKLLLEYCSNNQDDELTEMLNQVISKEGGGTLLYLNVAIKLEEIRYMMNPSKNCLEHLEELTQEYKRVLEIFNQKIKRLHLI